MRNPQTDYQAAPQAQAIERAKIKEGQKPFVIKPANPVLSQDDRAEFYTGQERVTLQMRNIQRVRDLQETNDNLQQQDLVVWSSGRLVNYI